MVSISIKVIEFRNQLTNGRLGTVNANGRTIEGRKIESFKFERGNLVDYIMADGKIGPKFQDVMFMDD